MDRGEYRLALPLYQDSIRIQKLRGAEGTAGYASTLNNLARLLQFRGEHRKAMPLYEASLALLGKTRGKKPTRAACFGPPIENRLWAWVITTT